MTFNRGELEIREQETNVRAQVREFLNRPHIKKKVLSLTEKEWEGVVEILRVVLE